MTTVSADLERLALAAAHAAADATAELVRYAREGDYHMSAFDNEPIEKLLDAAKMALEIEGGVDLARLDGDQVQVYAAIARYLEGWAA